MRQPPDLNRLLQRAYYQEPVRILIKNRRNALERAMLQFANSARQIAVMQSAMAARFVEDIHTYVILDCGFADRDDYQDPAYRKRFRTLLSAIQNHICVDILYESRCHR